MLAWNQLTDDRRRALREELERRVDGEVRFDGGSRGAYSTDASNFRQIPIGVVVPHTPEAAAEAVAVCRHHDCSVFSRGGGTSLAGQCTNTGVVIDWSKFCNRVVSVDESAGTAVVEPGITLDDLNDALNDTGWMVGPRPSTHVSCTIGGMIGNNSCGATAQAYGKMVDSVRRLEVLTYNGLRMWVGPTSEDQLAEIVAGNDERADLYRRLCALRDEYADEIRRRYPEIPRRVSGYNLDSLLPEMGFNVAQLLVGSESTLVTVLRAEIGLVRQPKAHVLAVLGFSDIQTAGTAVTRILRHEPAALEGFDSRLVSLEHVKHLAEGALDELPDGDAWLIVQFNGDDTEHADKRARAMLDDLNGDHQDAVVIDDTDQQERMWKAREAGLGATAHQPNGKDTHAGWEDAAVPPEGLGDYLADFQQLLKHYDYGSASLYGHFGQGCIHTRIPFDLTTAEGIAKYRNFVEDAAHLVTGYGGSLSGEHGDGQQRGELLPIMFGEHIIRAFSELKDIFDPQNNMNPGKVVHPRRLDTDLRWGSDYRPIEPDTLFSYPGDDHRFSRAANRCVGVGKCRGHESGVMCPSYRATGEEEHSTRGRARLLFEMLQGDVITDGWRSTEVRDALDLCLACKGCRSDCPVNVDMATYKAEFMHHHYKRRLRPLAHYSMGWLPLLARIAAVAPRPINALAHTPGLTTVLRAAGGIDHHRDVPRFAAQRFTDWFGRRPIHPGSRGRVILWPDTFTNSFDPHIGKAAVAVLEDAGFEVHVPRQTVCCGLTWISTGQLEVAQHILRRTLTILQPALRQATPVVVLEPSCAAVFRSDLPELLHDDEDAHRLAQQTRTIGELLAERAPDWRPRQRDGKAIMQPHCHQHAILGLDKDHEFLDRAGLSTEVLDAGCCGLAGNFGFERGHYDVSVTCAEDKLMPAVRSADAATTVIADGFSCRTQITHLAPDRSPRHTAEVLADNLGWRAQDDSGHRVGPRLAGVGAAMVLGATLAMLRHRGKATP
ncbi:FAD-binding and (Fe-S)-binding domain-containing protein [Mycolicibacterium vinylchloridicum]|uniref:FAD-binding and (Fe-S)-binding domain-containing protein n=1 Tax=Mycolicibacterium vinylchloridicum TaxID=2736928 RepID=UPI0015CB9CBF|nr:FAD-binding and (Fe-S)-binding domain-containing protein [Mycolicibacterium vinylchloridicum]